MPRGPPPANQPKSVGRVGPGPDRRSRGSAASTTTASAALTPGPPTANGGGGAACRRSPPPWTPRRVQREGAWRQDELGEQHARVVDVHSVTASPGTGGRSHSQSTTPTGRSRSFGGSSAVAERSGGSDGVSRCSAAAAIRPAPPTAGELNRRRNRSNYRIRIESDRWRRFSRQPRQLSILTKVLVLRRFGACSTASSPIFRSFLAHQATAR